MAIENIYIFLLICLLVLYSAVFVVNADATSSSSSVVATVPSAPAVVDLYSLGSDAIAVDITAPVNDGGSAVHSYKVEWDDDPGTREVQTISTSVYAGPNEVQSITLSAPSYDEIQVLRTTSSIIFEVQKITVSDASSGYFFLELDNSAFSGGSLQYSGYIAVGAPGSGGSDGSSVQDIINAMSNINGLFCLGLCPGIFYQHSGRVRLLNHLPRVHG